MEKQHKQWAWVNNLEYNEKERVEAFNESVIFSTELIKLTQLMSFEQVWQPLIWIAMQNDLNLSYVKDFQKARFLLNKSIMLN